MLIVERLGRCSLCVVEIHELYTAVIIRSIESPVQNIQSYSISDVAKEKRSKRYTLPKVPYDRGRVKSGRNGDIGGCVAVAASKSSYATSMAREGVQKEV